MAEPHVVVSVRNVSKTFVLRHTRSLKEALVWLAKGRRGDRYRREASCHPDPWDRCYPVSVEGSRFGDVR